MNHQQTPIQRAVLHQIEQGGVRMRPRVFFALITALGVAFGIAASVLMAYLTSMMIFALRIVTAGTPAYGARQNLSEALMHFPWWIAIVAAVLLVAGTVLLRRYGRLYRIRARNIVSLLVAAIMLLGLLFFSLGIGHPAEQPARHGRFSRAAASLK